MKFNFKLNIKLIIIILCLLFLVHSDGISYTSLFYDAYRGYTGKLSAMGNIVSGCQDAPGLYYNPASVMYVSGQQINFSVNFLISEERNISINKPIEYNFQNYNLSSLSYVLSKKNLGFGFGIIPIYDMQYKSENKEYIGSNIVRRNTTDCSGTLYAYTSVFGLSIKRFIFGAGINYFSTPYKRKTESYDLFISTYTSFETSTLLTGTNFSLSSIFSPSEKIFLGISYIKGTKLATDFKLSDECICFFNFNAKEIDTLVVTEIIFSQNKKTEFHIGVENFPFGSVAPVRYGVGFLPHKINDNFYTISFSCGSEVIVSNNVVLDFSLSYEHINIDRFLVDGKNNYIQQNTYKLICTTKFLF